MRRRNMYRVCRVRADYANQLHYEGSSIYYQKKKKDLEKKQWI